MNTQHELTVSEFPHTCGGYELNVSCSCGYTGTEARIGIGCADRDELHADLDTIHEPLLAAYYTAKEARDLAEWQATHPEATA